MLAALGALAAGGCAGQHAAAGGAATDDAGSSASAAASSSAAGASAAGTGTTKQARTPPITFLDAPVPYAGDDAAAGTVRVPILMYHRIADPSAASSDLERGLTVAPADFAGQMRWLKRRGYRAITQEQLYRALAGEGKLPARPVLITFDDGYVDVLNTALPILRKNGFTATAYVITSRIDGDDTSFLRMSHLRRLERFGVEIGSHSETHPDLTALSDADALRELAGSRKTLERGLGHPMQWFCYPAGRFDARIQRLAREAGYVLATTTEPGVDQAPRDPLALHRVRVSDTTGASGLAALLG